MQNRLREAMKERNKSIYALAKETGIAASTLSKICNDPYREFKTSTLSKICEGLKCEPADILVVENND
jgi:DNA-binding Xre family transcriptional regulator